MKYTNKKIKVKTMASPTVKIIKMRLPINGEVSTTAGSYAKAVSDAVGNTAAALTQIDTVKAGSYIIATVTLFAA